jgi:hypothetical protein
VALKPYARSRIRCLSDKPRLWIAIHAMRLDIDGRNGRAASIEEQKSVAKLIARAGLCEAGI